MRKDFVVKKIDTLPNDDFHVVVSFIPAKDFLGGLSPSFSFDPSKTMNPNNMNDMIKDLNKIFSGLGGGFGGITSIKLDIQEYKKMNLSVGDKVSIELTKAKKLGI